MDLSTALAGVSLAELALVAGMAFFASLVGGVAGYGTGVLMPLVLVPIAGAENVVPIIAITALFTNSSRVVAFRPFVDTARATLILLAAAPTCVLAAYGFTLLTGRGALMVIGLTLMLSVPVRRLMKRRGMLLERRGLMLGAVLYGVLVGGTTGSGIILLSLLMSAGLAGAAVIATDAAVSIALGLVKVLVFGFAGVVTAKVVAFALLIGLISVPGTFAAKALVERMPLNIHTAILDAVVLFGGAVMIWNAVLR